ncbi:beta-ketoacyl-[acyl-carrier-protein] synthase family protein [Mangrovihabitans endophyticus]|uniref:3-oxoacyl-[acyl-carrier-protein] synthase 2 n=1 Tax=Mangrovihabitans endophyticus TaxID=1751298 RepID=A0A8J3FMT3_9ACTN|nr:beta-ketoacyl-[acyl-carrier-protein] synthase family protein [Mangrovihabitans endophyticus]GGK86737.1 3-oxoacyl-[acyl-carrier-protein] synthase 2 [Mangrovihabitans endophyticus]
MRADDVVVTGLGATTPLGGDVAATWEAMLAGRSGVRALTEEWARSLPVRIAAPAAVEPAAVLDRVRLRRLDRAEALALIAAGQAWRDAGLDGGGADPDRLAVSFGSGIGGVQTLLGQDDILETAGARRVSPHTPIMIMPNGPAAQIGVAFGARAGVHSMASACATGAESVALARDLLRTGRADVVLAGGVEAAIAPLPIAAFAAMKAMSTRNHEPERASRPWDMARDGFVVGEGAGALVLERAAHAAARGARPYARIVGAGISSDGYDMVLPHPEGEGARRAILAALRDAGLSGVDVAHVNAHATSTPSGDLAELAALRAAVGEHAVLTATKSMTGHLLGAAGAVESVVTVLAVHHGVVPPTVNLDEPDGLLGMDVATDKPRYFDIPVALNNSFGFGGHNVALLIAR